MKRFPSQWWNEVETKHSRHVAISAACLKKKKYFLSAIVGVRPLCRKVTQILLVNYYTFFFTTFIRFMSDLYPHLCFLENKFKLTILILTM